MLFTYGSDAHTGKMEPFVAPIAANHCCLILTTTDTVID